MCIFPKRKRYRQLNRPFQSGHLEFLIDKRPADKGSGHARLLSMYYHDELGKYPRADIYAFWYNPFLLDKSDNNNNIYALSCKFEGSNTKGLAW